MKAGQVIEQDVPVQISLRIAKVDKVKREVEGICTQEVLDVHGEVVDHESMKAALLAWPGNIREMHQPIAVGKAVSVVSDDDAKATILRARISKGAPETWEKVLDETLCMYSIGGSGKKVVTKKADGTQESRLYVKNLSEVSLVDNGACPTAKFAIVKSVDGQAVECQPAELPDPQIPETKTVIDGLDSATPTEKVVTVVAGNTLAELLEKLASAPRALEVLKAVMPKLEAPLPDAANTSIEKRS